MENKTKNQHFGSYKSPSLSPIAVITHCPDTVYANHQRKLCTELLKINISVISGAWEAL